MSEAFARFRELVWSDPNLLRELWETPERDAFVALAVRLGEERGLRFTSDDVHRSLADGRLSWLARTTP
jgi:hypothetical protein